jgi:hypothetical protein
MVYPDEIYQVKADESVLVKVAFVAFFILLLHGGLMP